ncbi:hypothetical protein SLS62_002568 [Diatrype stigma]|uniref:Cytochrome P450 n=1 Tax=Diatrype stigma TaxID=117547 RepID=A0AAN9YUR5_9PEZI
MASAPVPAFLQHYLQDGITPSTVISTGIALLAVCVLGNVLYTLKFHALAGFPGPRLAAISRIPWWLSCLTGNQVAWIQQLHAHYGPVVRFSPNDLSFADQGGNIWKEIHAFERGRDEYAKAEEWFPVPLNGVPNILRLEYDDHRRVRQCFSPAFSDRALKKQESLFQTHADLLVSTMGKMSAEGTPADMVLLYNMVSFDIMANFTFGQPLGMLENMELSPWVEGVFESVKVWPIVQIIQYYPILEALFPLLEPKFVRTMRKNHFNWTVEHVDKRLRDGSDQPDLWNLVLSAEKRGRGLSLDEMHNNAELLMIAGSETTATLMAGLTYYLLVNPRNMQLLTDELRNSFTRLDDITMDSTANLKYLNACMPPSFHPQLHTLY